jgi:dihydropteroate synthase type 2
VPRILGILNLTRDSYSDGGRYLEPRAALEHAQAMLADGAAMIDVGAESSHPDAEDVPAHEEIRRLTPVLDELVARGARVSVDTYKPEVMRHALAHGARCINDIAAFATPGAVEAVRDGDAQLIVMHSTSSEARAQRREESAVDWPERIASFFERRVVELASSGIARERLILDPGMGFFLSSAPEPSLAVLAHLSRLRELGLPLCVSTSRKSFLGAVLGREVHERGAGTLATELWCARHGVDWIRTHDVRALSDALRITEAIERA